jgi:hypothetical protein
MMGRTRDPETLVGNQAKMTLGNKSKAKTILEDCRISALYMKLKSLPQREHSPSALET